LIEVAHLLLKRRAAAVKFVDRTEFLERIEENLSIQHVSISGDIQNLRTQRPDAVILQKPFRDADLLRAVRRALGALSAP
jgi:FixJ family two-component response regulator